MLCVRGPGHGAPDPHRGRQLRRLLQRAEEDRGQGAEAGGPGQAGRVRRGRGAGRQPRADQDAVPRPGTLPGPAHVPARRLPETIQTKWNNQQ